jgi:hypothetical protein
MQSRSSLWRAIFAGAFVSCYPHAQVPSPGPGLVAQGSLVPFVPRDSVPADIRDYRFTLPVEIHGHTFLFMADHGASATIVTDSTIDAVHLPHRFAGAAKADTLVRRPGIDVRRDSTANFMIARGDSIFEYWGDFDLWVIDSMRIAGTLQDKVLIAGESPAASLHPFAGLVGRDMLSQFDLEFNLPARTLRLYARSDAASHDPRWLPRGMSAADCIAGEVIQHMGVDTTGMDASDSAEMKINPGRRIWNEQEILLPLAVNGRAVSGHFDSGSGETIMNWAAARALGLDPASPGVTANGPRSVLLFAFHPDEQTKGLDTINYRAAGITLRLGARTLPADTVLISDLSFRDFADAGTKPLILVGLRHFRDDLLFLSYSTGKICIHAH